MNNIDEKSLHSQHTVKIFYLLFFSNLLINLDHGIIPAGKDYLIFQASIKIEESLQLSDQELGLLGSLVYGGIVVMGLLSGPLYMRFSAKKIIQISMFTMMASLCLFTIRIKSRFAYFFIRFLTGMSQAPLLIYFPVWVDFYGQGYKTMWLTLLQGGVPFGVFTGYVLSSVISTNWEWQWSFYLQIIVMAPCLIGFILVPTANIDIRIRHKEPAKVQDIDQRESIDTYDPIIDYSKISYFKLLAILLKSKVYVCVMLALCVCYFIVTGVQFWISNYMETVLEQPQSLVNTVFSIVSITAPTMGCFAGGATVQYAGGYESIYALPICFIFTIFSTGISIPIPFIQNFWIVSAFIWIQLFCGGASVPPLTGIMISSVSPSLRSFANSNTTTFVNLLGYLPAPSVFGLIAKYQGKHSAMVFLMIYPLVGFSFLLTGMIIQIKERNDKEKEKMISSAINSETFKGYEHSNIPRQIESTISKAIRSTTIQVLQPEGGTYLLLTDAEDNHENDHAIMQQIFEFHSVPINPGVAVNQEFLSLSNLIKDHEQQK